MQMLMKGKVLFKWFYSGFIESKIKLNNIFISMEKVGYFLAAELLAFLLCHWDFTLYEVNKQTYIDN